MNYYATDFFHSNCVHYGTKIDEIIAVSIVEMDYNPCLVVVPEAAGYEDLADDPTDHPPKRLYRAYWTPIIGFFKNHNERQVARELGFHTYKMLYLSNDWQYLAAGINKAHIKPPEKMPNRIRSLLGW